MRKTEKREMGKKDRTKAIMHEKFLEGVVVFYPNFCIYLSIRFHLHTIFFKVVRKPPPDHAITTSIG